MGLKAKAESPPTQPLLLERAQVLRDRLGANSKALNGLLVKVEQELSGLGFGADAMVEITDDQEKGENTRLFLSFRLIRLLRGSRLAA